MSVIELMLPDFSLRVVIRLFKKYRKCDQGDPLKGRVGRTYIFLLYYIFSLALSGLCVGQSDRGEEE